MVQTNQQGFPEISSPFVDENTGKIQQVWLQLLISLWQRTGGGGGSTPPPITPVTTGSSPFVYQASANGDLWISPGTYCDVTLKRGSISLNSGKITRGIFPMSVGDIATITYTNLTPTIYFL